MEAFLDRWAQFLWSFVTPRRIRRCAVVGTITAVMAFLIGWELAVFMAINFHCTVCEVARPIARRPRSELACSNCDGCAVVVVSRLGRLTVVTIPPLMGTEQQCCERQFDVARSLISQLVPGDGFLLDLSLVHGTESAHGDSEVYFHLFFQPLFLACKRNVRGAVISRYYDLIPTIRMMKLNENLMPFASWDASRPWLTQFLNSQQIAILDA